MVAKHTPAKIGEYQFEQYGSHIDNFPHHYLTVAAAIGITAQEIDIFIERLKLAFEKYKKKMAKKDEKGKEIST